MHIVIVIIRVVSHIIVLQHRHVRQVHYLNSKSPISPALMPSMPLNYFSQILGYPSGILTSLALYVQTC